MFKKRWMLHAVPISTSSDALGIADAINTKEKRFVTKRAAKERAFDLLTMFGSHVVIAVVSCKHH